MPDAFWQHIAFGKGCQLFHMQKIESKSLRLIFSVYYLKATKIHLYRK